MMHRRPGRHPRQGHHPRHPGERLTTRARIYMLVCGAQQVILGWFCVVYPSAFSGSAFTGLKLALPVDNPQTAMRLWGCVLVLVAAVCLAAAGDGRDGNARAGLLLTVIVECMWLAGYVASIATGSFLAPVGVIVWTFLIARDLTMLRNPLRNPFEPLIEDIVAEDLTPPVGRDVAA